ncbi:hypothetical protein RND81_03G188700 [Saponaria officinalis]|uniref:Uncharacterized protein n=1 Tax=Saponaria officinalis TaxID=3572 RepID=A0AAW1M1E1_SAPOF
MQRLSTRSNTNNYNMVQCKKHPKHKQSPGVCSLCLSEKLSRVSTCSRGQMASRARAYYYCSSSSLSSSEDESSYASSCVSPTLHEDGHHRRIASDVKLNINKYLSKSKSMPLVEVVQENKKKVVGGFWSKFLRPRRNNNHHLVNNLKNSDNNSNKVYMSQPLDVPSSSNMVVC